MSRSPEGIDGVALAIRDLSDPAAGPHAMQALLEAIEHAVARGGAKRTLRLRSCPLVRVEDNYDALGYRPDAIARDARYTRYVGAGVMLRTQTSAMIPPILRALSAATVDDVLLSCPGLVYRRDSVDRLHVGEPHQVDLWRLRSGPRLEETDLTTMITDVVEAALPGTRHRVQPASHPYTQSGLQIDVETGDGWVEIGECGLAAPGLLARSGLPPCVSGLAMGLGLDRLLMLRKGVDDIRLLRASDERVAAQMQDLLPYRPVSRMPPITRDLSIAALRGLDDERLGDRVREALGDELCSVESIAIAARTSHAELPARARERIGLRDGQENLLIRIVLRHAERTLTHDEANLLRDRIYAALHEGDAWQWARGEPPA